MTCSCMVAVMSASRGLHTAQHSSALAMNKLTAGQHINRILHQLRNLLMYVCVCMLCLFALFVSGPHTHPHRAAELVAARRRGCEALGGRFEAPLKEAVRSVRSVTSVCQDRALSLAAHLAAKHDVDAKKVRRPLSFCFMRCWRICLVFGWPSWPAGGS